MINHISYHKKNQYLLIGFLISLVIVYLLSVSKTISLLSENKLLNTELSTLNSSQSKMNDIAQRAQTINLQINKFFADSTTHDEILLKSVSELCLQEKVLLKDMPVIERSKEGNYHVFTNKITMEGGFHSLLKVLHQLENRENVGRIASADFKTYMDHKKKKEVLMLIVYIQTIIS